MKEKNPFPYSDDNKRYHTWNYYLKHRYQHKVYKVPLDAGFTCPNRDGTTGWGGCTFCSSKGSGDYVASTSDLMQQFEKGQQMMERKWPNGLAIAYFQAYSNTYGSVEKLRNIYEPFVNKSDIIAIAIATRPDCLNEKVIQYLSFINERKELWVELGLQTIHAKSADLINRGHDTKCFDEAVKKLRAHNIKVVAHLMNSLPNETKNDMVLSAKHLAALDIQAVKIHMLHVMKDTIMGQAYLNQPFKLLSKDEYIETVVSQLEVLPPTMIIQRLTGDSPKDLLIAPDWTLNKTIVLNDIDKYMKLHQTYQGRLYRKEEII